MRNALLATVFVLAAVPSFGQQDRNCVNPHARAAIERLERLAADSAAAAAAPLSQAKAGSDKAWDNQARPSMAVPAPDAAKQMTSSSKEEGIVHPEEPAPQEEGGQDDPESPPDQVARIIAEALKKPIVRAEIDKIRQEQMDKAKQDIERDPLVRMLKRGARNTSLNVGLMVAGAGLAVAAGATGILAGVGIGLAVAGGIGLLFNWLFK